MRIAVLNADETVANIIETVDEAFAKAQSYPGYVVLQDGQWCSIAATWDGTSFTPAPNA